MSNVFATCMSALCPDCRSVPPPADPCKDFVSCKECGVAFLRKPDPYGQQSPDYLGLCPTHREAKRKKDADEAEFRRDCARYEVRIKKLVEMWDQAYVREHNAWPPGKTSCYR